ncbi:hypothetical protein GWK47_001116 [Chionoecetes opilio]|uniref:Uncharacterized protein n=1 Tax=Chionoecetes opilio TaxID=41210 RepID=A0A8J5C383_CHIOP|nr:hypothetical protein GWK47_001116 [Chionoecetes opilio]
MASQRRRKYNLNISLERELYVNLPGVLSSSDTCTDKERQFELHCSETSDSVGDDGSGVESEERIEEVEEDAGVGIFLSPPYIINPKEKFEYYFPHSFTPQTLLNPNQFPSVPPNALMTGGFSLKCSV